MIRKIDPAVPLYAQLTLSTARFENHRVKYRRRAIAIAYLWNVLRPRRALTYIRRLLRYKDYRVN